MGWSEGCGQILVRVAFTVPLSEVISLSLSHGLAGVMQGLHRFGLGSMSGCLITSSSNQQRLCILSTVFQSVFPPSLFSCTLMQLHTILYCGGLIPFSYLSV